MRKIILNILTVAFIPLGLFAQINESKLAEKVCLQLDKLDMNKSSVDLNNETLNLIQKTYSNNQDLISELLIEYRKTHTKTSDLELSKLIGQKVTYFLMDNCENYQRITMFHSKPVPKISETTRNIGDEFTELLIERSKSEPMSQSLIDKCIYEITEKRSGKVEEKFGHKYSEIFIAEFQAYLMTESKPYMNWLSKQIK